LGQGQGRRKYLFTNQIDQLNREIYLSQSWRKDAAWHPRLAKQ